MMTMRHLYPTVHSYHTIPYNTVPLSENSSVASFVSNGSSSLCCSSAFREVLLPTDKIRQDINCP